jgi:protein TonB
MFRFLSLVLSGSLHAGIAGATFLLGIGAYIRLPEIPVNLPPPQPMAFDLADRVTETEFAAADPALPPSLPEEVRMEFEPDREEAAPVEPERPLPRPERPTPPMDRPRPASLAMERIVPPPAPVSTVDTPAEEICNPPPDYPAQARRRGLEGEALIEITILPDGACGEARLVGCSGSPLFGEAALAAVRKWRYRPAARNGQTVVAVVPVRFVFRLRA